jgi:branched-chain amino acid transport system substrate-binding protein
MRNAQRAIGVMCTVFMIGVLAACGSSSTASSSSTTSAPGSATGSVVPAVASGTPIKIAFRSLEGGSVSLPEIRIGFEEGVKYVNEVLGGVDGHPLEVSYCKVDATPEKAIDCANKAVEDNVVLSVQGADPSADAALPILSEAGIAEVSIAALGPKQQADVGNSFVLSNPAPASNLAAVLALKNAGASKVRFFQNDDASARFNNDTYVKPTGEKVGVDADTIYYTSGNIDWTSLVASAQSAGADGIGVLIASEPDCTGMMTAAQQLGFQGAILAGNCKDFVEVVGADNAEGVLTFGDLYPSDVVDSAPPEKAAEVTAFVDQMNAGGHEDLLTGFGSQAFSEAVTVRDMLSQIQQGSNLTASDILTGMPKTHGQRFMGSSYICDGTAWAGTSTCMNSILVLQQTADGGREVVGDGYLDLSQYRP